MFIFATKGGFQVPRSSKQDPFKADPNNPIPALAACYLPLDLHYIDSLKTTDDRSQQIAFYEVESAPDMVAEEAAEPLQIPEFKSSQVARVRKGDIAITDICIGCCCDFNRAADSAADGRRIYHPLFEGLLCKQCLETIKTTMYAPGEDNKNVSLLTQATVAAVKWFEGCRIRRWATITVTCLGNSLLLSLNGTGPFDVM